MNRKRLKGAAAEIGQRRRALQQADFCAYVTRAQ